MNIFLDKETKVLEKFMSVPQDTRKACVRTRISQVKPILGHIDFSTLCCDCSDCIVYILKVLPFINWGREDLSIYTCCTDKDKSETKSLVICP